MSREGFRLFVEYLKRSENYKVFCDFMAKKTQKWDDLSKYEALRHEAMWELNVPGEIELTYPCFGNIHDKAYSFEHWWKQKGEKWAAFLKNPGPNVVSLTEPYVRDLAKGIEMEISAIRIQLHQKLGREATGEEVIADFIEGAKYLGPILLRINPLAEIDPLVRNFRKKAKEAKKHAKKIMKTKVYGPRVKLDPNNLAQGGLDKLKKYLRVYDLDNRGIDWIDIICDPEVGNQEICKYISEMDDVPTPLDFYDEWSIYLRYIRKAKKIIKNSERCIFPGDYQ
jgi:hypothetical protein